VTTVNAISMISEIDTRITTTKSTRARGTFSPLLLSAGVKRIAPVMVMNITYPDTVPVGGATTAKTTRMVPIQIVDDTGKGIATDTGTGIATETETGTATETEPGTATDTETGIATDTETKITTEAETTTETETRIAIDTEIKIATDTERGIMIDTKKGIPSVIGTAESVKNHPDIGGINLRVTINRLLEWKNHVHLPIILRNQAGKKKHYHPKKRLKIMRIYYLCLSNYMAH